MIIENNQKNKKSNPYRGEIFALAVKMSGNESINKNQLGSSIRWKFDLNIYQLYIPPKDNNVLSH